jgi:molybdopterin-containing oxidoreductase family membrane subunit
MLLIFSRASCHGLDNYSDSACGSPSTWPSSLLRWRVLHGVPQVLLKIDSSRHHHYGHRRVLCYSGPCCAPRTSASPSARGWLLAPQCPLRLTEVIFCITCYCLVPSSSTCPILEQKQRTRYPSCTPRAQHARVHGLFAGIGGSVTFHQAPGRQVRRAHAVPTPSARLLHLAVTFSCRALRRGLRPRVLRAGVHLHGELTGPSWWTSRPRPSWAMIAGTMLTVYFFFKFLDTWAGPQLPASVG